MGMQNKLVIVVILVVLIGAGIWYWSGNESAPDTTETEEGESSAPERDVMEVVMEFYTPWLDAAQSTTTDPYQSELFNSPLLHADVQDAIQLARADSSITRDPVLCQDTVPERIGTKIVYEQDTAAEVAVLARNGAERSIEQAAVTLEAHDGAWQITAINCVSGESAPEREFTFEQEGFLLKDSLPETMDRQYWHLVYEQQGQSGYTLPLFFDAESVCIDLEGGEVVCEPNNLQEASHVFVQGQMLEAGLEVKRLHALPNN